MGDFDFNFDDDDDDFLQQKDSKKQEDSFSLFDDDDNDLNNSSDNISDSFSNDNDINANDSLTLMDDELNKDTNAQSTNIQDGKKMVSMSLKIIGIGAILLIVVFILLAVFNNIKFSKVDTAVTASTTQDKIDNAMSNSSNNASSSVSNNTTTSTNTTSSGSSTYDTSSNAIDSAMNSQSSNTYTESSDNISSSYQESMFRVLNNVTEEKDGMVTSKLYGTIDNFDGTYVITVDYSIGCYVYAGDSFKVEVLSTNDNGTLKVLDIKY